MGLAKVRRPAEVHQVGGVLGVDGHVGRHRGDSRGGEDAGLVNLEQVWEIR